MLEIELKFALTDPDALRGRLAALGAAPLADAQQSDAYYNHPARDFAATDEALRVRSVGTDAWVTYKGPKQGGTAKSRYELELPLSAGTAAGWDTLLQRLGFGPVAVVRKRRQAHRLDYDGRPVEVSIDLVEGLGAFAEVEALADAAEREAVERVIGALACDLGLERPEPRSYLEMLLAAGTTGAGPKGVCPPGAADVE